VSGLNLLVVDWDYFFPNPWDGGNLDVNDEAMPLYDWAHRESPFHTGPVWSGRGAAFLANDLPLPEVVGWQGFWDRFELHEEAPLLMAESNLWAGTIPAGLGYAGSAVEVAEWPWESVWLYDAHHDSGYNGITLDAWREKATITCEDWMLVHGDAGSALHVRYPTWKVRAFEVEKATAVPVDRQFDDGTAPPVVFDCVFLCRSGAWVPPWCDHLFEDFAASYPGGGDVSLAGPLPRRRQYRESMESEAAMMRRLRAMMPQLNQKGLTQQ
jgi:hypothetical protein